MPVKAENQNGNTTIGTGRRADHEPVVGLGADDAANALSTLPHGIEGEVVALLYLEGLPQILQPRPASSIPQKMNHALQPQLSKKFNQHCRILSVFHPRVFSPFLLSSGFFNKSISVS